MELNIIPLPQELQKIANEELGEVTERIYEDLKMLKEWIQMQPHLKARTDDRFLLQFLRGSKHSLEKTKDKLEHFYRLRAKYADMLTTVDVDSSLFSDYVKTRSFSPPPIPLNGNGPRIIYANYNIDPRSYTTNQILQIVVTFTELLLLSDPYASINGILAIFDFEKFTTDFIAMLTPNAVKCLFLFIEKAMPARFRGLYLINISTLADKIIKILWPYIPEKVKNRVHVYSNIDDMQEQIPRKYLPKDIGGENGSIDKISAEYLQLWEEYRDYFRDNSNYGLEESLRLGNKCANGADLGIGGSFRAINVD
uniref:CRAL-TRIO domain-containing protein n=2 Tax=Stomoxys calcitrans TaxID=35570 RepID=A0A1I8NMV8_STOCA